MQRAGKPSLAERWARLRASPELRRQYCTVVALFLLWMTLNISLNLGVNHAMKPRDEHGLGFDFPLAFTMTHMFFSMAGCSLVMAVVPSMRKLDPHRQLNFYGMRLVCLSFFYVLAIAANNMSLINLGLSINQIIKSCAPLPVLVFAYALQGKSTPRFKVISVVLLVIGAVMAVPYGHPHVTGRGLSLAVVSTLSVGMKAVLSSILLDNSAEAGLIPVVVAWYDACLSGFLLLLACLFTNDIHRMVTYFMDPEMPWEAVPVFVALGTVAFVYNFVALAFIQATSALAIMVAGNLKHVLLIIMPAILYDSKANHQYSAYHWIGISLFFVSLLFYTAFDIYATWNRASAPPPRDDAHGAGGGGDGRRIAPDESTPLNANAVGGASSAANVGTAGSWWQKRIPDSNPA